MAWTTQDGFDMMMDAVIEQGRYRDDLWDAVDTATDEFWGYVSGDDTRHLDGLDEARRGAILALNLIRWDLDPDLN